MGNRILKESIRRSRQIDQLSWFEEVVYYRLLTVADDYGRMDGRIVVLTHDLFPTKDNVSKAQVSRAVKNMISLGLLAEYQVDGAPYLCFPTWDKHQSLRRAKAKYPAPPSGGSVPPSGGQSAAIRRQIADNPPQSGSKAPSNGGSLRPKCGPTRAAAESESESESETPPAVVVESETREAPTAAAGAPDGNPFGVSAPPRRKAGSQLQVCGAAAPLSSPLVAPAGLPPDDDPRPSFDTVEVYAANNLAALTPGNMEELAAFKEELPEVLIRHAIDEAASNGKRVWSYVRSILRRYAEAGYRSVGDALADEERRAASRRGGTASPAAIRCDYIQHEYAPDDLDGIFVDLNSALPGRGGGT